MNLKPLKSIAIYKGDIALYAEGYEDKLYIFEYDDEKQMYWDYENEFGYDVETILFDDDFIVMSYDTVVLKENLETKKEVE